MWAAGIGFGKSAPERVMPGRTFVLVIVDRDSGEFTVEGPMSDDRPWNRAVVDAQKSGRNVRCFGLGDMIPDAAAAEWQAAHGGQRVAAGSCRLAIFCEVRIRENRTMPGRQRLPGGEPRKASQRNTRRAAPVPPRITPTRRPGDSVRWRGRVGVFQRDAGDGEHCEIVLGPRVYRVPTKELD
jgi:hypothetical protein